jgi:hypothetical protein
MTFKTLAVVAERSNLENTREMTQNLCCQPMLLGGYLWAADNAGFRNMGLSVKERSN